MKISFRSQEISFNRGSVGIFDKLSGFDVYNSGYAVSSAESKEIGESRIVNFVIYSQSGLKMNAYESAKYAEFVDQLEINAYIFKNETLKIEYKEEYMIVFRPSEIREIYNKFMKEKFDYQYMTDGRY